LGGITPDGSRLGIGIVSKGEDNNLYVSPGAYDVGDKTIIRFQPVHDPSKASFFGISPSGRYVLEIVGQVEPSAFIYDTGTGKALKLVPPQSDEYLIYFPGFPGIWNSSIL
jgi:hypothetical protein